MCRTKVVFVGSYIWQHELRAYRSLYVPVPPERVGLRTSQT